jgi:MSHA biogenesis protein MshG
MPNFSYKGRSIRGALVQGELEAASMDAVATQLFNTGITPIDINEKTASSNNVESLLVRLQAKRPSLDDIILFTRQMYTMMKSGVPIVRAMNGIISSTRNIYLADALKESLSYLESGRDLASSLGRHPEIFPTLFISMVRVGEETGRLDESFMRITRYLELEKETRQRIKAAIRYPIFVIVAIAIAMAVINIFVIPTFADLFAKADVALPWQTRLLMMTSDFFVAWWPVLLAGLIGAAIGFRSYIQTEKGRYWWDRNKLRIPIIGNIIHRATLGRFARAFSMALTSGVPLVQAMTVVARSVDNEYVAEHILNMRNGIERGESLTRTATITGQFTPLVLQMLSVGEETGEVDNLLVEVADFYEREVDYDIKNLSSSIEPVLIIAIGIMVLILALGVFLPMWDISQAVG